MTPKEAEALARALGDDHPLQALAKELCLQHTGRFPSWCCQKCGNTVGWLGRLFCGRLYPHRSATGAGDW